MAATSDHPPRPEGPILFFDGGCALCHGAVRRLLRWERSGHLNAPPIRFAPLNGPTAESLRSAGQLSESQEAVVLWTGTEALEGEAAAGAALDAIGRTGWAGVFRILPRILRRAGYRMTARNRHRWFGRMPEGCPMPAEPDRMLP